MYHLMMILDVRAAKETVYNNVALGSHSEALAGSAGQEVALGICA